MYLTPSLVYVRMCVLCVCVCGWKQTYWVVYLLLQLYIAPHGKILAGEDLTNLVNHELSAKIFLTNIHRCSENVFGIYTDCSLFANFSSSIAFICMVRQIFWYTVHKCYYCVLSCL